METCFLFTCKDEPGARQALGAILRHLQKQPVAFITSIKLGKCKDREIEGWPVIEPWWVIVIVDDMYMQSLDQWACDASIPCDDIYGGPGRVREFDARAKTVECYAVTGGKAARQSRMTIKWETP